MVIFGISFFYFSSLVKISRFKSFVFLPLFTLFFFFLFCTEEIFARSSGCFEREIWYMGRKHKVNYGDSKCPHHYKHLNRDPNYIDYEPVPMTIKEAFGRGWSEYSSAGVIRRILNPNSEEVYFFCP